MLALLAGKSVFSWGKQVEGKISIFWNIHAG